MNCAIAIALARLLCLSWESNNASTGGAAAEALHPITGQGEQVDLRSSGA